MGNLFIYRSHELDVAIILYVNSDPLLASTRWCLWPHQWIWSLCLSYPFVHDILLLRTVSSCKSKCRTHSTKWFLYRLFKQIVFIFSSAQHCGVGTKETLSVPVINVLYLLQHALLFRRLIIYIGIRVFIIQSRLLVHASLWLLSKNRFSYVGFVAGTWSEISLTIRETGHGSDSTFLAKFIPFVFEARVWNMCIIGDHFLIVHSVLTGVRGLLLILASASFDRFFILDEALWSSVVIIFLNEVFLWSDKRVLLPG